MNAQDVDSPVHVELPPAVHVGDRADISGGINTPGVVVTGEGISELIQTHTADFPVSYVVGQEDINGVMVKRWYRV